MNVATFMEASARVRPHRLAVVSGSVRLTYEQLNGLTNRCAHGLIALGVKPGDKVALTCPSLPEFVISYYAILKIGAVAVPLNLLLKRDEIAQQLGDSDAKIYLCYEGTQESQLGRHGLAAFRATPSCESFWAIPQNPEGLAELTECRSWYELLEGQPDTFVSLDLPSDAPCSITFTSGTTGLPKGAEHTHASEYISSVFTRNDLDIRSADVAISGVPLFSAYRIAILHATFLSGSTVVLMPRFVPAEVWKTMECENVTVFHGIGTMYHRLYEAIGETQADFDKIARNWRLGSAGGAPLEPAVFEFLQNRFGVVIRFAYGLTEAFKVTTAKDPLLAMQGSVGCPVDGIEIGIVDEQMNEVQPENIGEIIVRSPTMMKRYFNSPEGTQAAFSGGWLHTGDLARQDAGGNIYLAGRLKDMINRGGYKVYPAQVETVLMTHPAIAIVAVVGIPDKRFGEEVKAYVVLKDGARCSEVELIAWARERVAAYAYPRHVEFAGSLPLGPTGKVLKRLLGAHGECDAVDKGHRKGDL